MLNSTPLGEVASDRIVRRHCTRAGYRIGDNKTIDLLRYAAWLVDVRRQMIVRRRPDSGYEAIKQRARARNIALSLEGRDIGELPAVVNPERKQRAERDFRFFCEQYFPLTFTLPWSADHLKVISKIEQAVLEGGLFAVAIGIRGRSPGCNARVQRPLAAPSARCCC